ncbi:MAG: hypothetical protein WC241_05220 [Candidatus Paceibacterota bacterium]|jgi:hypothetical protein
MRKFLFTLAVIANIFFLPFAFTQENITLTTYYPAPFGVYENLRLFPTTTIPTCATADDEGTMYYDNNANVNQLMVCRETALGIFGWVTAGSNWTHPVATNILHANDINWNVGIGTTNPTVKLDVARVASLSDDGIVVSSADNHMIRLGPSRGGGGNNPLTQAGDSAIIYSGGAIDTGALVIGQWSNLERGMRITSMGNVGIRTGNPTQPLQVYSSADEYLGQLLLAAGSGQDAVIGLATDTGNNDAAIFLDKSDSDKFKIALGNTDHMVNRNTATKLTITQSGDVGIGTNIPISKLEIVSDNPVVGKMGFGGGWHDFWYDGGSDNAYPIIHVGLEGGYTKFSWKPEGAPERELLFIRNNGTVQVPGTFDATTVTANVKNFKINHPAKPGKKLIHSTLEGPEIAVFYRGEAQLVKGEATIKLPDYFEALTRKEGRTIQLTAKGKEPFLLSCADVTDGKFFVYGAKPDGKFYWEVKAVRADIKPLEVEIEEK